MKNKSTYEKKRKKMPRNGIFGIFGTTCCANFKRLFF